MMFLVIDDDIGDLICYFYFGFFNDIGKFFYLGNDFVWSDQDVVVFVVYGFS